MRCLTRIKACLSGLTLTCSCCGQQDSSHRASPCQCTQPQGGELNKLISPRLRSCRFMFPFFMAKAILSGQFGTALATPPPLWRRKVAFGKQRYSGIWTVGDHTIYTSSHHRTKADLRIDCPCKHVTLNLLELFHCIWC